MSYRVRQYHSRKTTEQKVIEGFLKGLWWIISLPFRLIFGQKKIHHLSTPGGLDRGFVEKKWQEIEQLVRLGNPSNFSRAVLEADNLLDHILKSYRAPGTTMGERLKASQNRFSPEGYQAAWQGHKVRNEVVHNSEYQLMDYSAKAAISNFKKATGELIK